MVFLDSNIFIIDRFFPLDKNYQVNKCLVEKLDQGNLDAALPYYTLLEICGITSFNLSNQEQEQWLYSFSEVYLINVLDPFINSTGVPSSITGYLLELTPYILKKMTIGDAIFLKEAEMHNAAAIVTWNKKHFLGRTQIPIYSPDEFLQQNQ